METKRTHPLVITAAVAVILASGIAIASMTGLLPNSQAKMSDQEIAQIEEQARLDTEAKEKEQARELQLKAEQEAAAKKPVTKPVTAKPVAAKPAPVQTAAVCNNCGRVVEVRQRTVQGEGSGFGAVAGGVVGGLLGNQIGGGNGKKVATAAGVVGGAVLGNKIEKDRNASTQYDVVVQFDDGGSDVYSFSSLPSWQSGDRVKVVNGQITSNL
jgi:outer membrane lipoprotein SlyB